MKRWLLKRTKVNTAAMAKELGIRSCLCYEVSERDGEEKTAQSIQENADFAAQVGYQAARQGYVLISGNARGADSIAQNACLEAGGQVISVVADELAEKRGSSHVLYVSLEGFDLPFTPARALSRNRVIHALGEKTLVAQCAAGMGGTWDGTVRNLHAGWSPVFCFPDGSEAVQRLIQLGAGSVRTEQLSDLGALQEDALRLF